MKSQELKRETNCVEEKVRTSGNQDFKITKALIFLKAL